MTWWKSLLNLPTALRSAWRDGFRPGSPAAWGFAVACVTLAAAVRFATSLFSADVFSFATFYPATLIVTLVGGLWLGVLAAALGGLLGVLCGLALGGKTYKVTASRNVPVDRHGFTPFRSIQARDTPLPLWQ